MNTNHIQGIFSHYIEQFDVINNEEHNENYKWFVAKEYHALMEDALGLDGPEFAEALYKVKTCTYNIIDSYTQPFYGLVQLARQEPETVKQMFLDLYSDDGGDLHIQERLIADFFNKSNELLEKYYPGSHRYKQNSHSASAYLFLYDPDYHYMYKATQSQIFADCIEFYDDWGSGDNIKLDVYYRMCDWIVEQIMRSPKLLAADQTRYNNSKSAEMFPDQRKHILTFDLIYCCSVYDLFDGITFARPKSGERKVIAEKKEKATALLGDYNTALDAQHKLDEGMYLLKTNLEPGTVITHKKFGEGKILFFDDAGNAEISFAKDGTKKLSMPTIFGSGFAKTENGKAEECLAEYAPYLKEKKQIGERVKYTEHMLEPYKEYLE